MVPTKVGSIITVSTPVPAQVTSATLKYWLEADGINGLANGSPVGTWNDLSGAGRNATQASTSAKPSYTTGIVAGHSGVRFNGIGSYMVMTGFKPDLTAGYSLFLLINFSTSHDGIIAGTAFFSNGTNGDFWRIRNNGGAAQFRTGSGGSFYDASISTGVRVVTVTNAATTSGTGILTVWIDTVQVLSQTVNRSTVHTQDMVLGTLLPSSPTQVYNGDIIDKVFYQGVVNSSDRNLVQSFLMTRAGQ